MTNEERVRNMQLNTLAGAYARCLYVRGEAYVSLSDRYAFASEVIQLIDDRVAAGAGKGEV